MTNDKKSATRIKVTKDGPYVVIGSVPVDEEHIVCGDDGEPARWAKGPSFPKKEAYSLCRCGASKRPPFCDGSHVEAAFDGTETAGRDGYLEHVEKTVGPGVDLTWSEALCIEACFCHRGKALGLTPRVRRCRTARGCRRSSRPPSGSLVAWDKAASRHEPSSNRDQLIGTRDRSVRPWVKGGVLSNRPKASSTRWNR
jgi:CDGSH-type Zn-finger protein